MGPARARRLAVAIVMALAIWVAGNHGTAAQTEIGSDNNKDAKAVAKQLFDKCIKGGQQVVLYPDKWICTAVSNGEEQLADLSSDKFNPDSVCSTADKRIMPTGVLREINSLADADVKTPVETTPKLLKSGIRIIGGLYCEDEVNLSNINFPVPLNLDRSVLKYGFRARNFKVAGNFSIARSYIYDNFDISDSNINGTIFGRGSFMQRVRLSHTTVLDNLRFNNSILLEYFVLADVSVSGAVDVSGSKLNSFSVRGTKGAERLELSQSEATCKYRIDDLGFNEILAVNAGFGKTATLDVVARRIQNDEKRNFAAKKIKALSTPTELEAKTQSQQKQYRVFSAKRSGIPPQLLEVSKIASLYSEPPPCDDRLAVFSIAGESTNSVCIQNFYWNELAPNQQSISPGNATTGGRKTGTRRDDATIISINNVKSIANLNINLWGDKNASADGDKYGRVIEIIGTKIGSLFLDFKENDKPFIITVDQITIDRARTVDSSCGAHRSPTRFPTPEAKDVNDWLEKNTPKSFQPYAAFVKAFENAGVDTTEIKVAKAGVEFDQTFDKYNEDLANAWAAAKTNNDRLAFLWNNVLHLIVDYAGLGAKAVLGYIADYGFRPAQVLRTVLVIVAVSWLVFWLFIRVVAFQMAKKPEMRVIGLAFLFDRLLPVYKLRDDHYDVGVYYQRGTGEGEKTIQYFGRPVTCTPASARRVRCAEIYLDFLKLLGIVLAAFLVAAVNALIAR